MLVLHLKRVCDLSMFISFLIIFYAKILGPFISRGDRWRGIRLVVATGVAIPPQCHYCKRQHAIQKEILHFSVIMMIQKRKSLQLILNGNSERRKSKLIRGNSNVHGQVLDNVYIVHCMRSKGMAVTGIPLCWAKANYYSTSCMHKVSSSSSTRHMINNISEKIFNLVFICYLTSKNIL